MDTPIVISPHELWTTMIAVCAAIITISGACTAIALLINKVRAPERKQDLRIENLEKSIEKINERLDKGDKRFGADTEKILMVEANTKAANKLIIEGLQTLVAHAIDGNNIDELKKTKHNIDEYLLSKM